MLDLLFDPQEALRHPIRIFFVALVYSSLSVLVGLWIFSVSASLAIVFLTTISCLYIIQASLRMEERKEKNYMSESWTLRQHKPLIVLITSLFLGFVVSFALWTFFLPPQTTSQVFDLQQTSLDQIRAITGNAIDPSAPLVQILRNNINIVFISLIFAFFFGAGAIYIIVWNASVMGFVIGEISRKTFGLAAIPFVAAKYFLHGIPEMVAYIIAAVAGGILYFGFIRGDLTKADRAKRIFIDVFTLVILAIVLLVLAAIVEVYISPLI